MLVTRTRRTWAAVALAAVTTIASAGIAAADDIYNNLDLTIDAAAESMTLTAGGATGSTTLAVQATGTGGTPEDGKSGCNLTGSTTLKVQVASDDTDVATVALSNDTFTSCGDTKTVTVTPVAAGTATVTVSQVSNNTGGTFNFAPARFTVTVNPAGDTTAPVISYTLNGAYPGTPDGLNGWWTSDVTLDWTVSDPESPASLVLTGCDDVTVNADQAATNYSCSAESDGGSSGPVTVSIKRDATGPVVALVDGPADGEQYYFGSVPAAPTCTASDSPAGLADSTGGDPTQDCVVSGYGTTVGSHTVQAQAWDRAGNTTTVSHDYEVLAWTATGFYRPVDMGGVVNRVKGGSTVPLKFELFAGDTELTDATNVKESFTVELWNGCATANVVDNVEMTSTGGTEFRYDTTGGQFIQNWKLPPGKGCYKVTFTAKDQSTSSTLVAYFEATK